MSSSATQNQHKDTVIAIDALARLDERIVHTPRHGVSRFGAIESQERDRGFDVEEGFGCSHA
jgi:hypothetical protein